MKLKGTYWRDEPDVFKSWPDVKILHDLYHTVCHVLELTLLHSKESFCGWVTVRDKVNPVCLQTTVACQICDYAKLGLEGNLRAVCQIKLLQNLKVPIDFAVFPLKATVG
jgi:hypothetical protein